MELAAAVLMTKYGALTAELIGLDLLWKALMSPPRFAELEHKTR